MILIILFAAVKVTIIKIIIMIIIMIIIVTISRINRCATELVLPRSLFGTNGLPSLSPGANAEESYGGRI